MSRENVLYVPCVYVLTLPVYTFYYVVCQLFNNWNCLFFLEAQVRCGNIYRDTVGAVK